MKLLFSFVKRDGMKYGSMCERVMIIERLCELPSTEFHPNQITSGILIRHIFGLAVRFAPGAFFGPPPSTIYI